MGQGRESSWIWRINNPSTYVSMMEVSKDVVVLDYKEQKTPMTSVGNNIIFLVGWQHSFSFFSWPICRDGWRPEVLSASDEDVIDSVTQIAINSKDDVSIITACAGGYGRGAPV